MKLFTNWEKPNQHIKHNVHPYNNVLVYSTCQRVHRYYAKIKEKKNQGSTCWTEKMSSDTISWFGEWMKDQHLSGQCVQILYSDLREITKDQHWTEKVRTDTILWSGEKMRDPHFYLSNVHRYCTLI